MPDPVRTLDGVAPTDVGIVRPISDGREDLGETRAFGEYVGLF